MTEITGPPVAGDEAATLLGALERERVTFAWKCGELDAAGLSATVGASSMTLGGLLKHLALVEDEYFTHRLLGRPLGAPWDTVDWDADQNWEWISAVAEALDDGGLEQRARTGPGGQTHSMRRILVDIIEEYSRHLGHADLIRESVDGLTGEDPSQD